MNRTPRPRGRHRDQAATPTEFRRHFWDRQARSAAHHLDQRWHGWTVMYGTGSRLFYAFAAWPFPKPLILSTATAAELEKLMCEAEMAVILRREAATTGWAGQQVAS
ncbi:hypothetical protein [Rhizohabitans arisaemae]|uniref:hypothetical protein n=1 Tax=Rhizohabitans arisaemae TaxID=2720610 RepID=UPI0024B0B07E|nr:hypothetical protein [Rhizohabitans arisaemae]